MRQPGIAPAGAGWAVLHVLASLGREVIGLEGPLPDQQLEATTASEYLSLASVAGRPSACSGEMYAAVPNSCEAFVIVSSWAILAIPKSATCKRLGGIEDEVVRLDVPVDDAPAVREVERVSRLAEPRHGLFAREPRGSAARLRQCPPAGAPSR